ncbi:protein ELYS [Schistocerca nitens]|uniref:protein ELYS n=1 Tax=Schistocerca nitens TaxID=7011 RepID=UPI002118B570|nr:protein ELYS [Schistocerca nitens]
MDGTKAPCNVSRNLKLSNGKYNASENGMLEVKGGVFKDCKYAWTSFKTELRLFRMSVGNKIATWRFGADVSQSESVAEIGQEHIGYRVPHVTCVCELPPRGAVTGSTAPQLLVGLDCGPSRGGAVCICDSSSGSVVTTINVLHPVSSLSVIDGGASPASRLLSPAITNMCGVAAVGLTGCGYVMLVDLRRHDPDGPHTAILLNEESFKVPRKFALKGSDGKVRCYLPSYKVDVTCVQYVPCITSLLVGYNFGCFEIWDLREQKIRYVSPVMEQTIPVAHIAFQEPSDDPRNFCYVWTVHSPSGEISDNSSDSCHPVAFMYALCYQWKEWIDGCGYIYEGFKGCSQHYFFEMKAYENKETLGGNSLTCQAIGTAVSRQHRSLGPDDFDDSVNEGELSLCLFAWQSMDTDCKSMLRVALFDLDRWYKEEMPQSGTGSYIVVFHLEDTLHSSTNPVLDVVVDESSLQPYRSDTGHEEYYRPSALSFVSQILFEDELVEISHPGEQQFLLSHLDKSGPLALLHPAQLYKHCLSIGLRPALFDITSPSSEVSLDQQRRFLLALALEWQMSGFLHSCAVEWASGSQSVAGCSLPVLLTWGWEFALAVKDEASKLCAPLFDHSGTKLDRAGRRMLSMYRNQLGHLAKLFSGVLTSPKIPKIYVPDSVEKQAKALEMISLYFEVVQWFMNAGLLPEFPDDGVSYGGDLLMEDHHKLLPYPASVIKKFYEDRRADLKDEVPLFVDLLLEQDKSLKLKELWVQDGGSGFYPPPSLQALLQTYLIDVLDTTAKHRFVIYVFLDLAETLDDRYAGAINYLIKFPAAFYMRPSIIKITQAMWLLDHKDFEEALRMLLDPMIRPIDLEQWQHRAIALAFLKQGKADLALDYIVCRNVPLDTFEDIKLKISILIENKKVLEAYECQSMYSIGESNQELMEFFLRELHRAELMDQIFYLTLTPMEEKSFFQFLEKSLVHGGGGTKLIYYLQQCRIIEAFETVDILERRYNENYFNESLRSLPYKYVAKSVEGLPEITRKTADVYRSAKAPSCNTGTIPEPLSMTLYRHKSSDPLWDKSTGIETILRKIKETWVPELVNDADSLVQKTPFLFSPFHFQLNRHYNSTRAVCVTEKKRGRQDEEKEGTPPKRRRTEDLRPVNNSSTIEEPHEPREVDVSLLLDTPRIKRLSELRATANASFSGTPVRETSTHHSILKVHSVSKKSLSPEDSVSEDISRTTRGAASKDHGTEMNTDGKKTEEKKESETGVLSASRQIRFALPKESNLDRKKSVMGASPRKALYEGNVAHTRDTQVGGRRPGDMARPLCFFPKPSSGTRDTEASVSKTVCTAKKAERSLSFSPSPRKRDSVNSEERVASRVASIKGKYFFPPKSKVDDDSEENQEDSFVSATSDIDSNTEDASGDAILSSVLAESVSKDLKQNISSSTNIVEYLKLEDSVQSVDDRNLREKCVKTDDPPRVTIISPRITKRESYRKSNVSFLTDHTMHGIGGSKLLNSPSKHSVKFDDSRRAVNSCSLQTADGIPNTEKSSTSFACVSIETESPTSTTTTNGKSILSFSRSSITHNVSYTSVLSRRSDEALSAAGQKCEDDGRITQGATSHLESYSLLSHNTVKGVVNTSNKTDKDGSKSSASFLPDNTVRIVPGNTSTRQTDERRESLSDSKQTERTVLTPIEDVLASEKTSLMGIGTKTEDSTSLTSERSQYSSSRFILPDATIQSRHGKIVDSEQLGGDVSSAGMAKENQKCVSFNARGSPKLGRSSETLAGIESGAVDDENSAQKECSNRLSSSFLPHSSNYDRPGVLSFSEQSAVEVRVTGSAEEIQKSGEDTPEVKQLSKALSASETGPECFTRPTPDRDSTGSVLSFLPHSTVYDSPVSTPCSRQSEDLQKSVNDSSTYENNVALTPEDTLKTDKSSASVIDIVVEAEGNVSFTPKKTCNTPVSNFLSDTTRFLPDNSIWNTPSNSSCTRHSDNGSESVDNTKKSVNMTMEGTLETDNSSTALIGTSAEMGGNISKQWSASPTRIRAETCGAISSTPKKTLSTSVSTFLPDTTRYLPDNTVWNMPSNTSSTKLSDNEPEDLNNTKESERSVVTMEETLETDKSSPSLLDTFAVGGNASDKSSTPLTKIRAETGGNVSSTPKETISSLLPDTTRFLPDNTIWNTPTNSACTRHCENEPGSVDNTKMSERSVLVTLEETLETDKSTSLVGVKTGGNVSSMPQGICSNPVPSFLPDTTTWNSPSHSFDGKLSASEIISPLREQENSQNATVTIEDSLEMEENPTLLTDSKNASRYLPDDTSYNSPVEKDVLENRLDSEPQGSGKSADKRSISGRCHTDLEDKEEKCPPVTDSDADDVDDDDDDEDWHASAVEEEEDSDEADDEPVVADDVSAIDVESASSSSASIVLISSSSSSTNSDSDSETAADERKYVGDSRTSSVDFDPLLDPECDTAEEVVTATILLKDLDTESQNVDLQHSGEDCRDGAEMNQTLSAEHESIADTDPKLRDNSSTDATEKAKETEYVDIRSISTGGCKVSEPVSAVEPPYISGTADCDNTNTKRSRKGLKERKLSRCSSEPPANVEVLGRLRTKKTRSTDSLNNLTGLSVVTETYTDKVSQSKDEAGHSHTTSKGHKNNIDNSPNAGKVQIISDIPELPNESVSDDIRNSIQEWMNSPIVTRAGFRRLSSIQSEPPLMDDVSDIVSLPRTRRKKTSSVIMESTSPKKRGSKSTSQHQESTAARSEVQSAEHEQRMEEYTTERRLTRYQRSLLARSADLAAGRGRSTPPHDLKTFSLPSQSPVRLRSSDRHCTPSPGDADNVSVAQSEGSEVSSSLTSSSYLQRSPRSARSESIIRRPSRRNHNTAVRSPSSVCSMPVAPAVSRHGRLRQVKKRGGEVSEELQKDASALHPARRTKSHSSLDASKRKSSPNTSHEDLTKQESQAKELRVTRSVARLGPHSSQSVLQPIPEESTSSSVDVNNKQPAPTERRKRKHTSRSPVSKKTSPRNKKQESTRISPRKAMRLRSRLLK